MDGRGECCIARYMGCGGGAYDMSKVDRIMLRFRPIAPKPATGSSRSALENTDLCTSKSSRGKRKHTNNNNNNNNNKRCYRKRKASSEEKRDGAGVVVTLPLLPETPDRKDRSPVEKVASRNVPMWLSFGNNSYSSAGAGNIMKESSTLTDRRMVGSCVTVECVTDTWVDGDELGSTDEERRMNLGRDTCPGFISDGYGRVTWTNEAYGKMVGQDDDVMVVWLVMKEKVPVSSVTRITYPAFTCRVRLQYYTCGKERSSLILPCDVWRMDCGGFAWRLDVKAALCLGR